jgi:hypothetical protein
VLEETQGVLGLPMIRNSKTLDPRDECVAAGVPAGNRDGRSHRRVFGVRGALRVPRHRFAPGQDD